MALGHQHPYGWSFSVQSTDLHTLWKIKRAGKKLREWGELWDGYVYWRKVSMWFSLCQFKENVLLTSNLPFATETP